MSVNGISLKQFPLNLGPGASAIQQPEFKGGMDWYQGYGLRHGDEGIESRLVTMHTFSESWDSWEMHPLGSEVVVCVDGAITLIQEDQQGEVTQVNLSVGEYAINLPGVWHTADVSETATALFITSGMGTEHRPRA